MSTNVCLLLKIPTFLCHIPRILGQESQQPISLPSNGTSGKDHSYLFLAYYILPSVSTSHSFQSNHLPTLVLPSFNGNPRGWQSFWDTFQSAVHDHSTVSDVQKFNYLKAQLCDSAERVITGLPPITQRLFNCWKRDLLDPTRSSAHTWKHYLTCHHLKSLRFF